MDLHDRIINDSGGSPGVREVGLIESALHTPITSAGGDDAYPRLFDKVAALGYSLAMNHGFQDGNKRTAYGAMYNTLVWNGHALAWAPETAVMVLSLLGAGHLARPALKHALVLGCGQDINDPNLD